MKIDNVDKIIGAGLIAALLIFFVGQFVCIALDKTPLPMEIANTIAVGLIGFMSKLVTRKEDHHDDNQPETADTKRAEQNPRHSQAVEVPERIPNKNF